MNDDRHYHAHLIHGLAALAPASWVKLIGSYEVSVPDRLCLAPMTPAGWVLGHKQASQGRAGRFAGQFDDRQGADASTQTVPTDEKTVYDVPINPPRSQRSDVALPC